VFVFVACCPSQVRGKGKEFYPFGPPGARFSYPASTKETERVYGTAWFEETESADRQCSKYVVKRSSEKGISITCRWIIINDRVSVV
jgi:hypothetical protein